MQNLNICYFKYLLPDLQKSGIITHFVLNIQDAVTARCLSACMDARLTV